MTWPRRPPKEGKDFDESNSIIFDLIVHQVHSVKHCTKVNNNNHYDGSLKSLLKRGGLNAYSITCTGEAFHMCEGYKASAAGFVLKKPRNLFSV